MDISNMVLFSSRRNRFASSTNLPYSLSCDAMEAAGNWSTGTIEVKGAPKKSSSTLRVLTNVVFPRILLELASPINASSVFSSSVKMLKSFETPS